MKKIEKFVDHLEDEIFKRTDIDSFEKFMVKLSIELSKRYIYDTDLNSKTKK